MFHTSLLKGLLIPRGQKKKRGLENEKGFKQICLIALFRLGLPQLVQMESTLTC